MIPRFQGCLLGALLGDVLGAAVEGESAAYIARAFRDVDEIAALRSVPEILGRTWMVGRFTDDTQMSLCMAEWVLEDCGGCASRPSQALGEKLLRRFHLAYHPGRRYGAGTARILEAVPQAEDWRALATLMFPGGSYGNGSAMRVAPLSMAHYRDMKSLLAWSTLASRTTHSHPLALAGSALQAVAVALVLQDQDADPPVFLGRALSVLERFGSASWPVAEYRTALALVAEALAHGQSSRTVGERLGNGVAALETVPLALFCYLRHPDDFRAVIEQAIFAGGDTDTTAAMAGALCGARVGLEGLPKAWLARVSETEYTVGRVARLAAELYARASAC